MCAELNTQELLRLSRQSGWQKASVQLLKNKKNGFLAKDFAIQRTPWLFFCDLPQKANILEIGCSLGSLTFTLAKEGFIIAATDPDPNKIEFVKLRAEQDNTKNISTEIFNKDGLLYKENSFDLIILNPISEIFENDFLISTIKALRPNGKLYMGTHNSLCPLHAIKKSAYENALSIYKVRRLLSKAGLKNFSFYLPLPHHNHFAYFIPFSDQKAFDYAILHLIHGQISESSAKIKIMYNFIKALILLKCSFLIRIFAPSFCIIAEKKLSNEN